MQRGAPRFLGLTVDSEGDFKGADEDVEHFRVFLQKLN